MTVSMNRGIRWGYALVLASSALGCASARQTVMKPFTDPIRAREMRFDFAQVLERDGDLHKAEKAYRELSGDRPKEAKYQHRLGVVLVRQGSLEEGIEKLQLARKLEPENVALLNDLGYALLLQGDFAGSEEVLVHAMKMDPRNKRASNNLALAVGYQGRSEEAYTLFRYHQSEAEARSNLAYVLAQRGDVDGAVKEYNQSLSRDPSRRPAAEAYLQLVQLQKNLDASRDGDLQLVNATTTDEVQAPVLIDAATHDPRAGSTVELLGEIDSGDDRR